MRPRTYLETLKLSFTSIIYYFKLIHLPWHHSLRFFLISLILLSFFPAWQITRRDLPLLKQSLNETFTEIKTNYPDNLIIDYHNQQLNLSDKNLIGTDIDSPIWPNDLFVSWPSSLKKLNDNLNNQIPQFFLIYTHSLDSTYLDQLKNQNSTFLVANPNQFYFNDQGTWISNSWQDLELSAFSLNKETLISRIDQWQNGFLDKIFKDLEIAVYILMPIFLMLSRGLMAFFYALLVWFLNNIVIKKISYLQSLQLTWHMMVVAETINQLTKHFYTNLTLPMFSLTFWAVCWLVIIYEKRIISKVKKMF